MAKEINAHKIVVNYNPDGSFLSGIFLYTVVDGGGTSDGKIKSIEVTSDTTPAAITAFTNKAKVRARNIENKRPSLESQRSVS